MCPYHRSYQYPYHIAKAQQKEIPTSPFKFDQSAIDLLLNLWVPKLSDGESINPGIDNGELRGDVMRQLMILTINLLKLLDQHGELGVFEASEVESHVTNTAWNTLVTKK